MSWVKRTLKAWLRTLGSDWAVVERQFRRAYGRPLDLEHPVTFDEKLQWYLASELRARIRHSGVEIRIVDRQARAEYRVEPRA